MRLGSVNYFGTSPRYFQTLEKAKYYPNEQVKLDSLTVIAVTGAPVTPDVYDFVANRVKHTYLFNASGGTGAPTIKLSCTLTESCFRDVLVIRQQLPDPAAVQERDTGANDRYRYGSLAAVM